MWPKGLRLSWGRVEASGQVAVPRETRDGESLKEGEEEWGLACG